MISETTDRPLVSIYCLTYNHEKYIRDCLDGLLMQKTDFPFEIIVHDDASTDGTQSIIREYETAHPQVIHTICQKENQRQKKVPMVKNFIFPKVRGKYVAICEGDDYWTDAAKLQTQVELLEKHPECHFCVCGVEEVSANKTPLGVFHPAEEIPQEIIEPEKFIELAGKYAFHTSSYLMRYDDWAPYVLDSPPFYRVSDIGDLPMLLYFGSLGSVGNVNRVMSCYRRGAPDSYSNRKNNWQEQNKIRHFKCQCASWREFDLWSSRRFHEVCAKKVSRNMFGLCVLSCSARDFLTSENREYYRKLPVPKRLYILLAAAFPRLMKWHYTVTMKRREEKELALWAR